MELMELVDIESAAKPFQCSWTECVKSFNRKSDLQRHYRIHTNERPYSCMVSGCNKSFIQRSALTVHVRTHTGEKPHQCQHLGCGKRFSDSSSLARHRRIHTGKRPYKCTHDGCSKRKTTMVKHHRRSHLRGLHTVNELDDGDTSDSDDGESPTTPNNNMVQWTHSVPSSAQQSGHHGHVLQRAHSYNDFSHHSTYASQHYGHRHSVSFPPHEYHGVSSVHEHYHNLPHRPLGHGSAYFVPEQNNPGVATMNTNNMGTVPRYHVPIHIPEQHVSFLHNAPGSLQTSPGGYSSTSGRSPTSQDMYYTHQQPQQVPGYPPQAEHQPTMQYQPTAVVGHGSQESMLAAVPEHRAQDQQQQGYYAMHFQEPQIVNADNVNPYANSIASNSNSNLRPHDTWSMKIEDVEDYQLPTTRMTIY